jgi:ATP-dependent Clp protease adaptor protein ClpS
MFLAWAFGGPAAPYRSPHRTAAANVARGPSDAQARSDRLIIDPMKDAATMVTAPDIGTRGAERELTALLPPYAVILHNDDVNDMTYVVRSLLMCVPELSHADAAEVMLQAHLNGKARVIACPLERAELYRDRLQSRGLTATIELA